MMMPFHPLIFIQLFLAVHQTSSNFIGSVDIKNDNSASTSAAEITVDPVLQSELTAPWGTSTFGILPPNYYSGANQLDIRRSGWSWPHPEYLSNYGPFCIGDGVSDSTCHTKEASSACKKSGGTPINNGMFCAFAHPKTVLGPTCWNGVCYDGTDEFCEKHGGHSIADTWCILDDVYSVIGPAAFANSTYPLQLESVCSELGGYSVGSLWCVVEKQQLTVIGPTCWGDECFKSDLVAVCEELEGYNIASRLCVVEEEVSVIGPTCWGDSCFTSSTSDICSKLGGKSVGNRFCVVKGKYSTIGPLCYGHACFTGSTNSGCSRLGGYNINDHFCVLKGDYAAVGPTCWSGTCYTEATRNHCKEAGGTNIGDHFCVLQGKYSVVGPTCWEDKCFVGATARDCHKVQGGKNFIDKFCLVDLSASSGSHRTFTSLISLLLVFFAVSGLLYSY